MNPPVLRHPGRWLWLLLFVPIALGLGRLELDVEVFDLLPNSLRPVEGLKLYQQYFANARELIITVNAPTAEQAENAARKIAEQLRPQTNLVATVTWEPPWMEHPEQAAELLAYLWLNQPPAVFGELTNRLAPERLGAVLASAREELATSLSPQEIARLSYDPLGLTRLPESAARVAPGFAEGQEMFSSSNGTFRILFVQASHDLRSYHECDDWLRGIRPLAQAAAASAGLDPARLGFTGRPAFVAETAIGMEHDITYSVGGTALMIAFLFWLAHKRIKPMLWLLVLLALVLGATLALGGLIYGKINVVSMGFAAILLGLAVDYAVVHYQEALAHPSLSIPAIRRAIAPSIFWAAFTTISAFMVLHFGGLPGLGQLGTLVGMGVALAACIMIFEFLPPLFPERRESRFLSAGAAATPAVLVPSGHGAPRPGKAFALTALLLLSSLAILSSGLPSIDPTAEALRPRRSDAFAALTQIQANLNQKREPLWLIVSGRTENDVARRLEEAQTVLARAVSNHVITSFNLPTPLWPRVAFQTENRANVRHLAEEGDMIRQAALTNGFAPISLGLTENILDTWTIASQTHGVFWPSNAMSRWIFEKLTARTPTNFFALGFIKPADDSTSSASRLSTLEAELPQQDVWLSGWGLLGEAIFSRVMASMWKMVTPMVFLVLLSLGLAFRRPREILLSLASLLTSALCLLAVMRLAGWSWNLLNLMAIPLVLGTGVDYGIFMQLGLRRYHGDVDMAYRVVGRALRLCGGTAIAGFGSLAWSSNAGMASLGQVCAVGIACNMLVAVFLLPAWWSRAARGEQTGPSPNNRGASGSSTSA